MSTPGGPARPVVCFGEMLMRLSSQGAVPLAQAGQLALDAGGAEANVAVALASLGTLTRMVTTLPRNPLGQKALTALRSAGVDTGHVVQSQGRMGLYFFEPPSGLRAGRVTYDRSASAFAASRFADYDLKAALDGARLLHMSGITPALGPGGCELALAVADAAVAAGVPISFDGNYRANLWSAWDSDPKTVLCELVSRSSLFFGNHRDISLLLGQEFSGEGAERRRESAEAAFAAFPQLELIASTARSVLDADNHRISARVDRRETGWQTDELSISGIVDRIGAGDAFAAGVLHRHLAGQGARACAEAGLALTALKHSIPGDMIFACESDLAEFHPGGSDVRR